MKRAVCVFPLLAALIFPAALLAQRNLAGAAEARLALERLNTTGSVLMIAAHPDDENTALLAWLARGEKVRTGYLSLTRGEGGQNLIGSEQGTLLGLIRTQELLAARRIDGAEQFFSSAVDFGFSKTADETIATWGREKILGDIVYVIRKFRPDVILLRFSGTPRDGHGHHQTSAILGREAFSVAADPKRFPEQLSEVQPWQAKRLMWNVFAFNREQEQQAATMKDRVEVDLGEYNPLLGFSYSEIAGMSRSEHESQGMGSAERRGSVKNYLVTVAGDPAKTSVFDGVSRGWSDPKLAGLLKQALESYKPEDPSKSVALLLEARSLIKDARRQSELDQAVALCSGLWLDASTDRASAAPGSDVKITTEVLNRSRIPVELRSITVGDLPVISVNSPLAYNQMVTKQSTWKAKDVKRELRRSQPEPDPVLTAKFDLTISGTPITYVRPVRNRFVDKVRGELTRPFEVVPPVSVRFAESNVLFPNSETKPISVQVRSWNGLSKGTVRLDLPTGWRSEPASRAFEFTKTGEERTAQFSVTPPASASTADVRAVAALDSGQEISTGVNVIDYSHIPPITTFPKAVARLVRTDVKVLSKRVGYIMGAGDQVPAALQQIGCEVTQLSEEDLARADLSRFDAIVTGVRAYNTRPDLRANYQRLMDYVQNGGTMVVQYNVAERGPFSVNTGALDRIGPWPIATGNDRVTVEDSPVEFLRANHPLLNAPNKITNADFKGWIQERGLYFASEWDPHYQTLISTHDPGDKALEGGLLYAPYGKGAYVFTAYSWFRELPAGVPGAYRIFANLLSAGKTK